MDEKLEKFKKDVINIHDDSVFEYFFDTYTKMYKKMKIRCKINNCIFYRTPTAHLLLQCCPICKFSKGSRYSFKTDNIDNILKLPIVFEKEISIDRTVKMFFDNIKKVMYATDSKYNGYKIIDKIIKKHTNSGYEYNYNDVIIRDCYLNTFFANKETINNKYMWTKELIIKYFKQEYVDMNIKLPTYTLLTTYGEGSPEKSIYSYFSAGKNGNKKEYVNLILNLQQSIFDKNNYEIIYSDIYGNLFKSTYEFIFSCFCQENNIKYEYEPIRIKNTYFDINIKYVIPDFYLADLKIYVEIFGLYNIKKESIYNKYTDKIKIKKELYKRLKYKVIYLNVEKNIYDEVYMFLQKIYNNIKKPDIIKYYKYCIGADEYINNIIKPLLLKYNNGELNTFKNNLTNKNFIIFNYGSIENAITILFNIKPSKKCWKWDTYFNELLEYINKYNSLPTSKHELYEWCKRQRELNSRNKLEKKRKEKLNTIINWKWEFKTDYNNNWLFMYNNLVDFCKIYGRLPKQKEKHNNTNIGDFAKKQRNYYSRKHLKQKYIIELEKIDVWKWYVKNQPI